MAVFLRNHREVIAAMDFTVPTLTFGVLYCFFVIAHDRRRILHLNTTQHPTSVCLLRYLGEATPDAFALMTSTVAPSRCSTQFEI